MRLTDLSGLDLKFIDAYRRQRTDDGAATRTRYCETTVVRQLVNFALSRNLIAADPLKGLRLKKPKPTPQPCWTYEEVRCILAASTEEVRPALTLLAETGLRFGELAWLTWDDIDWGGERPARAAEGGLATEDRRPAGGADERHRPHGAAGVAPAGPLGGDDATVAAPPAPGPAVDGAAAAGGLEAGADEAEGAGQVTHPSAHLHFERLAEGDAGGGGAGVGGARR